MQLGWTWGCESPPFITTPEIWDNWKYRESATQARFTSSWGYLKIGYNDSMVSPVRDSGEATSKRLRVTFNDCDAGDDVTIYWRGSNTIFTQSDVAPAWVLYAGEVITTYQYLQIRVDK
jgi:hypothetical protein